MESSSQTKNLVIIYQKLFNVAVKRYRKMSNKSKTYFNLNIRGCASISSFKEILIKNPDIRELMTELCDSGEMLSILGRWRGKHTNLAAALKYFNIFLNLIHDPSSVTSWKLSGSINRESVVQKYQIVKESESLTRSQVIQSTTDIFIETFKTKNVETEDYDDDDVLGKLQMLFRQLNDKDMTDHGARAITSSIIKQEK